MKDLQVIIAIPVKQYIDKVRIRDYWEVRRNYIVEDFETYMYIEKRIKKWQTKLRK